MTASSGTEPRVGGLRDPEAARGTARRPARCTRRPVVGGVVGRGGVTDDTAVLGTGFSPAWKALVREMPTCAPFGYVSNLLPDGGPPVLREEQCLDCPSVESSRIATAPGAPADELTLRFEEHRRELTGYSYRMLGSAFEADDAVQETDRRLAGPTPLRGSVVAALVALPDRDERLPRHARRPRAGGPMNEGPGPGAGRDEPAHAG